MSMLRPHPQKMDHHHLQHSRGGHRNDHTDDARQLSSGKKRKHDHNGMHLKASADNQRTENIAF